MFIGDWVGRAAAYWPDRLAVVDVAKGEAGRFTYRQLDERACRLARWLRDEAGVRRGDRVGMIALNGVEYLDAFYACGKLGAIFVPFNWRLHPRELADLAAQVQPRVILHSGEFREQAAAAGAAATAAASAAATAAASVAATAAASAAAGAGPNAAEGATGSGAAEAGASVAAGTTAGAAGGAAAGAAGGAAAGARVGTVRLVDLDAGGGPAGAAAADGVPGVTYADILAGTPAGAVTTDDVDAEDIACLLFTGGTTGRPKAARISHRMIAWNILTTVIHEQLSRDDVTITHTPMFHTGGLLVYTVPLLSVGGRVVIMRRWDPDQMLGLIERERVTFFFCVPAQYRMLLESPRFARTDFSSVRFVTSGGAPLPTSLVAAWRAVHDVPFKQGFGMTEFGPGVFSMSPEEAERKLGSIGRPNFFVDARVVDDNGRPLPPGEVGELVLRGPALCSGYWGGDPDPRAPDGWFHTGDLARVDEDGFYYIVDRKKDMFISGGENVYPAEIEEVLSGHPAVAQCAVVGVPDERWGEVGVAFVVPRPGTSPAAEDILEFLRDRLARYKVPRRVIFLDALPLSAAGKVLKDELKRRVGSDG